MKFKRVERKTCPRDNIILYIEIFSVSFSVEIRIEIHMVPNVNQLALNSAKWKYLSQQNSLVLRRWEVRIKKPKNRSFVNSVGPLTLLGHSAKTNQIVSVKSDLLSNRISFCINSPMPIMTTNVPIKFLTYSSPQHN